MKISVNSLLAGRKGKIYYENVAQSVHKFIKHICISGHVYMHLRINVVNLRHCLLKDKEHT